MAHVDDERSVLFEKQVRCSVPACHASECTRTLIPPHVRAASQAAAAAARVRRRDPAHRARCVVPHRRNAVARWAARTHTPPPPPVLAFCGVIAAPPSASAMGAGGRDPLLSPPGKSGKAGCEWRQRVGLLCSASGLPPFPPTAPRAQPAVRRRLPPLPSQHRPRCRQVRPCCDCHRRGCATPPDPPPPTFTPRWRAGVSVDASGLVTREIREDTRLTAPELLAWFEQAGVAEMPEVRWGGMERGLTSACLNHHRRNGDRGRR
jgi:hypothetical protein